MRPRYLFCPHVLEISCYRGRTWYNIVPFRNWSSFPCPKHKFRNTLILFCLFFRLFSYVNVSFILPSVHFFTIFYHKHARIHIRCIDPFYLQNSLVLQVVYMYFCTKGRIRILKYGAWKLLFQKFICIVRHVDTVYSLEQLVASLEWNIVGNKASGFTYV